MVYKILCKDCGGSYIEQTRSLAVHLKKHQRAVFIGDKNTSALAEHVLDTGHTIDWDNASVMDVCQQLQQRLYLYGTCTIRLPSFNRERGSSATIVSGLNRTLSYFMHSTILIPLLCDCPHVTHSYLLRMMPA